jgi:predicted RNA binding protein YcfA (HicA-like mRNA interferase family)
MESSVPRRELIRKFKALGFKGPFSGGKHQFMAKGPVKVRIPNPHGSKEIHLGLLKEIIRQAGISLEDWDRI